jgi:hypothetical protein
MRDAAALLDLVHRVFLAKRLGPADRLALAAFLGPLGLHPAEVKLVYRAFLRATWGDVIDDAMLTRQERLILVQIVRALRLPWECAPFPEEILELALAV